MCRQVEQKTILDYILNSNIFKCSSRADPNALKEQYHEIWDFLIYKASFHTADIWKKIFIMPELRYWIQNIHEVNAKRSLIFAAFP